MMSLVYIFFGGAFGAMLRYILSTIFFGPKGILLCNLLGCLAIGIMYSVINSKFSFSKDMINFITVGFLGSFTTFSTFSLNIYQLYIEKQILFLIFYLTSSIIGGIIFLLIGMLVTDFIIKN